jgi:hypothetical protein
LRPHRRTCRGSMTLPERSQAPPWPPEPARTPRPPPFTPQRPRRRRAPARFRLRTLNAHASSRPRHRYDQPLRTSSVVSSYYRAAAENCEYNGVTP